MKGISIEQVTERVKRQVVKTNEYGMVRMEGIMAQLTCANNTLSALLL